VGKALICLLLKRSRLTIWAMLVWHSMSRGREEDGTSGAWWKFVNREVRGEGTQTGGNTNTDNTSWCPRSDMSSLKVLAP
jgi:hypothetical protein